MADTAYRQCDCGADCHIRDFEEEEREGKCWGQVRAVEELDYGDGDYGWIHACEGHVDTRDGVEYRSRPERQEVDG